MDIHAPRNAIHSYSMRVISKTIQFENLIAVQRTGEHIDGTILHFQLFLEHDS